MPVTPTRKNVRTTRCSSSFFATRVCNEQAHQECHQSYENWKRFCTSFSHQSTCFACTSCKPSLGTFSGQFIRPGRRSTDISQKCLKYFMIGRELSRMHVCSHDVFRCDDHEASPNLQSVGSHNSSHSSHQLCVGVLRELLACLFQIDFLELQDDVS